MKNEDDSLSSRIGRLEDIKKDASENNDNLFQHHSLKFLPSKEKINCVITQILTFLLLCGTLYGVLGRDVLPGSELFAVILLAVVAHIGGIIVKMVRLPPLIGMLGIGFLFRNLPFIPFYKDISVKWASTVRKSALVIILLKAGLGLDAKQLKRLSRIVLQLSFSPCIVETITCAVASHFLIGLPWTWALMLGFVISAVSPAVVVPGLLNLQQKSYGIRKGIPTLIIAAASTDDILAITGFSAMFSICVSQSNLIYTILKGILEPLGGLLIGILFGRAVWCLPGVQNITGSLLVFYRILLLLFGGFSAMFICYQFNVAGGGPMACLALAFVCALGWKRGMRFCSLETIIGILWNIMQPFMFSLIGAEVSISDIKSDFGNIIIVLSIGLLFRTITAVLATFGGNLNMKETIFVAFSWIPKATVQAAIGPQALDYVSVHNSGHEMEGYAQKILTAAVVSIIMTAPVGSALISLLGPLLLTHDIEPFMDIEKDERKPIHTDDKEMEII